MIVETGTEEDVSNLLTQGFGYVFKDLNEDSVEEHLFNGFKSSNWFYVAKKGSEFLGYVMASSRIECNNCNQGPCYSVAWVSAIESNLNYRRKGVGSELYNKLIQEVKGCNKVMLSSWLQSPDNSSYNFWKSLGFKERKEYLNYYNNGDSLIVMCKDC